MSQEKTFTFLSSFEGTKCQYSFTHLSSVAYPAWWSGAGEETARAGKSQTSDW